MNVKKANEFFGYALFTLGALKIIALIIIIANIVTNLNSIFSGGSASYEYLPTSFTTALSYAELILIIGSVVMIILNMKKQKEVVIGYLYVLGAVLIELIAPSIMSIGVVIVQSSMYMKAAGKIRSKNSLFDERNDSNKKLVKNTEWFFAEENNHSKNVQEEPQEIKPTEDTNNILDENTKEDDFEDLSYYEQSNEDEGKLNLTVILIALSILIALVILGLFIYIIVKENNKTSNIKNVEVSVDLNLNDLDV